MKNYEVQEMKEKFKVIKIDDLIKYVSPSRQAMLSIILDDIQEGRKAESKNADNKYLVINTDEPYADEIVEILKRNSHWG